MTEPAPDLIDTAVNLLAGAVTKEPGRAMSARNDVMRAQVYALLSIAESLRTMATPPPDEADTDEPAAPTSVGDAVKQAVADKLATKGKP